MTYGPIDFVALEFDPPDVEISGIIRVEDIDLIAEEMQNDTTAAFCPAP